MPHERPYALFGSPSELVVRPAQVSLQQAFASAQGHSEQGPRSVPLALVKFFPGGPGSQHASDERWQRIKREGPCPIEPRSDRLNFHAEVSPVNRLAPGGHAVLDGKMPVVARCAVHPGLPNLSAMRDQLLASARAAPKRRA